MWPQILGAMLLKIILLIGIVVLLIVLLHSYWQESKEISYVVATDEQSYLVRNLDDKQVAANLLAQLKAHLKRVVEGLALKHPNEERILRLVKGFSKTHFAERTRDHIYTSYTINKGVKMIFCLRQEDDQLVDFETLLFVGLHELTHVMTKSIDHGPEFWTNFKFMLKEAQDLGLYKYRSYRQDPVEYCGQTISENPLDQ